MPMQPALFETHKIRRVYDEDSETWWFSVVNIIQVLTQQADYQAARKYWNKLKERLGKEGSQLVTNCHRLKLPAADGKNYLTDVATAETLLRLVQSVPSPKAEPIKRWLAKVGYERMQEMADPALSLDRARETWQKHGRSDKWIQQRMTGQEVFAGCPRRSWKIPWFRCTQGLRQWHQGYPGRGMSTLYAARTASFNTPSLNALWRESGVARSTGLPSRSVRKRCSLANSKRPTWASGSNSTRISTSLPGPASPRTTDPNR